MSKNYRKTLIIAICALFISLWGVVIKPPVAYAFGFWGASPQQQQQGHLFWYRLRSSFRIDHYTYRAQVSEQIQWFRNHQGYLDKILKDGAPYMYYIYTQVKQRNLPGELVLLPIIESAYDPFAYSDRGAAGLWQLMPGTATGYGLKQDWWYDGRRDIYGSTNAALDYLTYLQSFFDNNWLYAIASYDAGEGTIQQAIDYNAHRGRGTSFWDLSLPRETHSYVPRLLALAAIIDNPSRYGITLPPIKDGPYFAAVNIGTQIDLAHAAKLAGISLKELYKLNPGFNRWATDPNGPYRLLLPVDHIAQFKKNLATLPVNKRVTWHRYQVHHGDSLERIARIFRTRVALLQEVNKITGTIIHPGQVLLIPRNANTLLHYSFSPELSYAHAHQLKMGPKKAMVEVHVGDSLWGIAHRYGLKVSQVRFWNHLRNDEPLKVGQRLTLWIPQYSHIPSSIHSHPVTLIRNYKVKPGDSLIKIAEKFHIYTKDLKKINHLHSNLIHVGQLLKIPPAV